MGIAAGLLLLCILIVIHELGHFWVAKLLGVRVLTFSVGFGPKLLKKTYAGTEYALSAIPLGGYVKMLGESPEEILSEEESKQSFLGQPIWKKSLIAFAGPCFNLILPIFLFFAIFIGPQKIYLPIIGEVLEQGAGYQAGLRSGDRVLAINLKPIQSFLDMVELVSSHPNQNLQFDIERQGQKKTIFVQPDSENNPNPLEQDKKIGRIGVKLSEPPVFDTIYLAPLKALQTAFAQTGSLIKMTILSLWMLATFNISAKDLGGPLMIIGIASQAASQGLDFYLQLMALISINLGILNLLPIPVLDGGHLFIFGIEALILRPINNKVRQVITQFGLFLLLALMALAMLNDITKLMH